MPSAQRSKCAKCGFVERQCVCKFIRRARVPQRIIVIQDIKESKHAKNTVKLLQLAFTQAEVIRISVDEDISSLISELPIEKTRVLYPSESAEPVELMDTDRKFDVDNLVLIDATWRRAKRVWLSNPSLRRFSAITFGNVPKSVYDIRKSPSLDGLSTFEACVYALEQLNGINLEHLITFMSLSFDWQWRDQPDEHKHR